MRCRFPDYTYLQLIFILLIGDDLQGVGSDIFSPL